MKRTIVVLVAAFLATPLAVHALDTMTRVVSPVQTWEAADLERFDPEWVQVKFVEGSNVLVEAGRFVDDTGLDLSHVNGTLTARSVDAVAPTFSWDRATLRHWKAIGERRAGTVGPDLSLWYDVRVEGGREAVARLVNELNADPAVEIAHPVAIPETAVIREPVVDGRDPVGDDLLTPDFTGMQDYLYDTPVGLDGPSAWAIPGGTGVNVKFIDVEIGWTIDHEDFDTDNYFYEGGANFDPGYEPHGTAVLGEVIGQHNDFGISGFAPDVAYGVVAITVGEWPNVPHYFQEAVDALDPGDVWLIELQMYPSGRNATPMEWLQVNYDVIWTSSWALEIVCVEAGANGSQDLDDPSWGGVFDRNVRDSGAIMVAAGTPQGRVAEYFTNYGSRMDVHAWGSQIVTTGYGDLHNDGTLQTRYTQQFGGTSGASPMVTGSVACLQGIAKQNVSLTLSPIQLRTILHDTGIDHLDPNKEIGPRPDLAAASEAVLAFNAIEEPDRPAAAALTGAPNPFRDRARIRFSVPAAGDVRLAVYDATGRRIRTLIDGAVAAGPNQFTWDGRDDTGRPLGSGVYFYRLDGDGVRRTGAIRKIR
ncbi:MAG: S8 family serine peptidase [Candidatus Eisenbacteria bacterium]|nr:S8 family serine peptidase [Candidatus Latescibacterota bacterium]MBD3300930.1 S8 family serine peptidase [Candidatus Eisenbacteria bacterium]